MAYSANGNNYSDKSLSRVKYDLVYDSDNDLYSFKGKPPEVIKIADDKASDIFFDSLSDFDQIAVDSSSILGVYGDQILFDRTENKNLIFLNTTISDPCLTEIKDFVNFVSSGIGVSVIGTDFIIQ